MVERKHHLKQAKVELLNKDDTTWKGPGNNLGTQLKFKMDFENGHIPEELPFPNHRRRIMAHFPTASFPNSFGGAIFQTISLGIYVQTVMYHE